MVRGACGNNDHPDPVMFLLIFRILSLYSLIKPSPGSNVEGNELLDALLNVHDDVNVNTNQAEWTRLKQNISNTATDTLQNEYPKTKTTTARQLTDNEIRKNLSGYVAKKTLNRTQCDECRVSLVGPIPQQSLIDLRNYFQVLIGPSRPLFRLITEIEQVIAAETELNGKITLNPNTFLDIAYKLDEMVLPAVGCEEHQSQLTGYVLQLYLVSRMYFSCSFVSHNIPDRTKPKEHRKMGKLLA